MNNPRGRLVFLGFAAIIGYLIANGHTVQRAMRTAFGAQYDEYAERCRRSFLASGTA